MAELRAEMVEMTRQHQEQVKALDERLMWYAENQQLIGANDRLVAEQVRT